MANNAGEKVLQLAVNFTRELQAHCCRLFREESKNNKVSDEHSFSVSEKEVKLQRHHSREDEPDPFQLYDEEAKAGKSALKEQLGRSTWTLLHTLAAQFPEKPTRQQKRDVRELMTILSRIYPCKECADHLKEILKSNPVEADSRENLAQWMCHVHNIVNRSLGKRSFPCDQVDARWPSLACSEGACDLEGRRQSTFR
eukprot:TRINITY_DN3611_c0_g1_i1.p1 TRINITY_DN3611_c0_g1~~TRINITY_DN3611_c0_g1_i1.p1  ORF type:complete len:198 (+),score=37.44 TRINITY_DN3611_c0_g1_i1:256-849(+)